MKYAALLVSALALAAPAHAQDESEIKVEDIPPAATEAAMKAVPNLTVETATKDMDEGTETFELAGTADGKKFEVDVLADGTVEEVEEEVAADSLPAEVKAALDSNLAGFAPTKVEKSTRADQSVWYEFEGTHGGKEIDAEIDAKGAGFKLNDDMAG